MRTKLHIADVVRPLGLAAGIATLLLLILAAPALATIIHTGANDPMFEGWVASPLAAGVTVGPISPDPDYPGIDAWEVNDASSAAGSARFYDAAIAPRADEAFSLRAQLRVVSPNDAIDYGVFLEVTDLSGRRYTASFGASGGATQIYLSPDGSPSGPATLTIPTGIPGQTEYLWVELVRGPGTQVARLLVNDIGVVGSYSGFQTLNIPARVLFGAGSSSTLGNGRYASVVIDLDPDGDGLLDLDELAWGTDPADPDSDDDGVLDGAEVSGGTDPLDNDSDDDGLLDGVETKAVWSWVTAGKVSGSFGGLAAGDAICAADGNQKGIVHAVSAHAWLSTSSVDARDHIAPVGPYLRWPDAAVVAANLADLTDGSLANAISTVYPTPVWTATHPTGVLVEPSCTDWTSESGYGGVGEASAENDPAWTDSMPPNSEPPCPSLYALICFAKSTDPLLADTDADGVNDGDEIAAGTDPTDPLSKPPAVPALGAPGAALLAGVVTLFGVGRIRRRPSLRAERVGPA